MYNKLYLLILLLITNNSASIFDNDINTCVLAPALIQEIQSYTMVINQIFEVLTVGAFKGTTYKYLSDFVDTFGNRLAGTTNLENAIDYILQKSTELNLENVHGEEVNITRWMRGQESATLLQPRRKNLAMLGLGSSIGTPSSGITAEVIVLKSFDELEELSDQIKGKIVVFNQNFISYGESVIYRSNAASRASKYGAVATLVRSVTAFSLNTPHTGWQSYGSNVTKIPTACITVEDANMLERMQRRGNKLTIQLYMEAKNLPNGTSRNTVTELTGREKQEKVVLVSGHLDSWDVGQGAMDNGAGAFIGWNALVVLKKMNLRPRRTLRSVLWTAEEFGLQGAIQYAERHKNESENFDFVMESDEGTFEPKGLEYYGSKQGACILEEILKLFAESNMTELNYSATPVSTDIIMLERLGIPGASLLNANSRYTWFHHTSADTMDVEDTATLDRCTAFWTAVAYVVADLSVDIPR